MKKLLSLLAILVAFISGCTSCTIPGTDINFCGGTTSLKDDIVIIRDLSAIPNIVTVPQALRVTAAIENQGTKSFPLKNNEGSSFSVDGVDSVVVELFDYCQGLFEDPAIKEPRECAGKGTSCKISELLSRELKEVIWELKPKEGTKLTTRCDFKVSVRYPYLTNGVATVNFINSKEYTRQLAQGTLQSRSSTTTLGEGPVKVSYEIKAKQPIPTTSDTASIVPVSLMIDNVGAGFVVQKEDKPTVNLLKTENSIFSTLFQTSEQQACDFKEDSTVSLIQDKRNIPCYIKQLSDADVPKETTYQLTAAISYLYEFRKEVRVTVEPKLQA